MNQNKTYKTIAIVLSIVFLLKITIILLEKIFIYSSYKILDYLYISISLKNIILIIPYIVGFIGLIGFIKSKFKKTSMVMFYMAVMVSTSAFELIRLYSSYTSLPSEAFHSHLDLIFILINLISIIGNIAICWFGLIKLLKNKALKLVETVEENTTIIKMVPLLANKRSLGYLIDAFVVVYFMINAGFSLYQFGLRDLANFITTNQTISICFSFFIYYIMMEGIFGITAAKCITKSMVVTESGDKPTFSRIVGRTFCRFIPFDQLSYLGESVRGWHDTISNTYVVAIVDTPEEA